MDIFFRFSLWCKRRIEEPSESGPSDQSDGDAENSSESGDPELCGLADGDAPADAEVPDAVAEVISACRDPKNVENKDAVVQRAELCRPVLIVDGGFGSANRICHRGCGHVIDQEEENEDPGPSLPKVVAVLAVLLCGRRGVRRHAVYDEKTVDGVEEKGNPDEPVFEAKEEVLRHSLEKSNDRVEFCGSRKREAIQREVLDHVEAHRNDPGEGVDFMPKIAFFRCHVEAIPDGTFFLKTVRCTTL